MTAPADRRDVFSPVPARPKVELVGTNPVLDCVEDGHFGRRGEKHEPDYVCRVCATAMPCDRLFDARRAAKVRADGQIAASLGPKPPKPSTVRLG